MWGKNTGVELTKEMQKCGDKKHPGPVREEPLMGSRRRYDGEAGSGRPRSKPHCAKDSRLYLKANEKAWIYICSWSGH